MSVKKDHSAKNAMKALYLKKYEIDKDFAFKVPRLKVDIEAYLHRILGSVEEAFEMAKVVKYKGHELKWASAEKELKDDQV